MAKLTLDDVQLDGKRALVRVDFNVPLDGTRITDDTRIRGALPTIQKICGDGGVAVLMSHLGRPKGQPDEKYSLKPVADYLGTLVAFPVTFSESTVGEKARAIVDAAQPGSIVVLENTRFHSGETKNDAEFSRQLAELGDLYVDDAFGAAHRAHASTVGVTEHLQPAVMGYLLQAEVDTLGKLLEDPARPFVAVLGGAKVSDKLGVIRALLGKVDKLLVGGAMAYTFLKALGEEVGSSMVEEDLLAEAREIHRKAGEALLLPTDHIVGASFDNDTERHVEEGRIADGMGLDIGPETRERYSEVIRGAGTVLWNGPMGVFEMPNFAEGTLSVARALASATAENGAQTVVGGGDSVAAITQAGLEREVSHVSTGGGAMLEFIEGGDLPGVAALTDR